MERLDKVSIDINSKLKYIDFEEFSRALKVMLRKIWMDSGVKLDQEMFNHTLKSLSYSMHNYHSSLLFAEIQSIFKGISLGQYKVQRISAQSIMSALNEYIEAKRKRTVLENDLQHQINHKKESFILSSGLPVGSAILFKMEQREKGLHQYDDIPLKEIAEKLKSGELKLSKEYKRR
jgi:phage tail tube protein FII